MEVTVPGKSLFFKTEVVEDRRTDFDSLAK